MITKRDPKTGRVLPKLAKKAIPEIEKIVLDYHNRGMSNQQIAGSLMFDYDINIHLANSLVKNAFLK